MMCLKLGNYLDFVNGYAVYIFAITTIIKLKVIYEFWKKFHGGKYFIKFKIMFMECRRRVSKTNHPQCNAYYYVLDDNHKCISVTIPVHVLFR